MRQFHLESRPDEVMVRCLGKIKKDIVHHDKGRIMAILKRETAQIAMVDEDPRAYTHPYLEELQLENEQHYLKVFTDKKRKNKVVMLCPNLEGWLIKVCQTLKIDLKDFYLPNDENKLHKEINQHLPKVEKLIDHLKSINAAPIIFLKEQIL
jgi:hypothetical protein